MYGNRTLNVTFAKRYVTIHCSTHTRLNSPLRLRGNLFFFTQGTFSACPFASRIWQNQDVFSYHMEKGDSSYNIRSSRAGVPLEFIVNPFAKYL